jgi:hypothetical protein
MAAAEAAAAGMTAGMTGVNLFTSCLFQGKLDLPFEIKLQHSLYTCSTRQTFDLHAWQSTASALMQLSDQATAGLQ